MFQTGRRAMILWTICAAGLSFATPTAQQQEFSSAAKPRGKAVIEYKDQAIQVVAAYNYSQFNHDSRWLLIESALSTEKENVIRRESILLRTPQGREVPLASQRRIGEEATRIEQLLQNAKVVKHDVLSYFNQLDRVEDMKLFRLPFGSVVHDEFIVDRDRVAVGPLFFEAPTGRWEDGTYALVVRHGTGAAELPIRLE